jgi:hypothetical protein
VYRFSLFLLSYSYFLIKSIGAFTTTCSCKFSRNILPFLTFLLIASSLLPAFREFPVVPASLPDQSVLVASYFIWNSRPSLPRLPVSLFGQHAFLPACPSVFTACLACLLICLFRLYRRGIILWEANLMSGFFQNIDPPPHHRPASAYPPAFGAGGGHTRWVEGGGSIFQYFGRRQTLLCTLHTYKYFVVCINYPNIFFPRSSSLLTFFCFTGIGGSDGQPFLPPSVSSYCCRRMRRST